MNYYYLLISGLLLTTACQQSKKEAGNSVDSVHARVETTDTISQAAINEPSPVHMVQDLYDIHNAQKGPFNEHKDRALLDRYFTRDLADLIWQDRQNTAKTGEVGLLDGDPLYNAQDMAIRNFRIYPATTTGNKAEVRVGFTNFGQKKEFTFLLDQSGSGWRIGDILYGDGSQLFQLMSGTAEETP